MSGNDEMPVDSLALLRAPFVFTQDGLLGTDDFIEQAREHGHDQSPGKLRALHETGLLVPLFWASDDPRDELRIDIPSLPATNVWAWTVEAARDGRLRDPQREDPAEIAPYQQPPELALRPGVRWWNGFTCSPWQLLDLGDVLHQHRYITADGAGGLGRSRTERRRRRIYALAALSPRFLSGVLGRVRLPPGTQDDKLWQFRHESNTLDLLRISGLDAAALRAEEETLLHTAKSRDPLANWLPLIRHAGHEAWSKPKATPSTASGCGSAPKSCCAPTRRWPQTATRKRCRACRTPTSGSPCTTVSARVSTKPIRWNARWAPSACRRIRGFCSSSKAKPNRNHVPRILNEFGLSRPEQVRVQVAKGSHVNAQLITRYGTTPRLGKMIGGTQLVDRTPTALILAINPENKVRDPTETRRRTTQAAGCHPARRSGSRAAGSARTTSTTSWKYEYGATTRTNWPTSPTTNSFQPSSNSPSDKAEPTPATRPAARLRAELAAARARHNDIKVALGRSGVAKSKTGLARLLWPVLLRKVEAELAADTVVTPVLTLVLAVRQKVAMLSGPGYALRTP